MTEVLTEVWIQSIIVGYYIEHAKHAPAILALFGTLLLVAIVLARNLKRKS
jgi:hypothetical protein